MNNFMRRIEETENAINAEGIFITEKRSGTHLLRGYGIRQAAPTSRFLYRHTQHVPEIFYVFLNSLEDPIPAIKKMKWVVVTREDALRRAISNMISDQTKQHSSLQPKKRESGYDFGFILHHLHRNWVVTQTAKMYLSHHRCPVLNVTYEELCADLNATVGKILDFVGIAQANKVSLEDAPFKKQADATTEEYVQRFYNDIGNIPLKYLRDYAIKGEANE